MAYLLFSPKGYHVLDRQFEKDPFRDQKKFFAHVWGTTGAIVILKHLALSYTAHLSKEGSEPVPTDDAKELASFTWRLIRFPLGKDLAIITCARSLEWALCNRVFSEQPLVAGSFVRDPAKAASEGNDVRSRIDAKEGRVGLLDTLDRRWDLAAHSFGVAIPPALVANAAIFTVEEAVLLAGLLRNRRERQEATRVLTDPKAGAGERAAASRRLIEAGGDRDRNVSRFLHQSLELAVKSAAGVPLEAVFTAVGTFLLPGTGTWLLGALGACLVWL